MEGASGPQACLRGAPCGPSRYSTQHACQTPAGAACTAHVPSHGRNRRSALRVSRRAASCEAYSCSTCHSEGPNCANSAAKARR